MRFNTVEQVLNKLENQPGWEKFRQHRQLLKCWDRTVNQKIAEHTRALYIDRQILYVATNSAARAQELSFQRYSLIKRLNEQLDFQLKDIRFSSSQWHQKTYSQLTQETLFTIGDRQVSTQDKNEISNASIAFTESPERCETEDREVSPTSSKDKAKNAVLSWLKSKSQRSVSSPLCPKCQTATSKKELARWNLCHHCVAQQWSEEYRPPTFPERK